MAGIVSAMSVTNADGSSFTFEAGDTADASDGGVAIQELVWRPAMATTRQAKGDMSGLLPTQSFVRGMEIEASGIINGSSDTDYWGRRAGFAAAIIPTDGAQDATDHGTVFATFGGTAYRAGVTLETWEAPVDLTGPLTSPYRVVWLNRDGYWTRVSDASLVRL